MDSESYTLEQAESPGQSRMSARLAPPPLPQSSGSHARMEAPVHSKLLLKLLEVLLSLLLHPVQMVVQVLAA